MSVTQMNAALGAWPQVRPALFGPHTEAEYEELVAFLSTLIDEVGENEAHALAS